jgi:chromate reductase
MTTTPTIKVLGISGSLRGGSYNTAALREAARSSPST